MISTIKKMMAAALLAVATTAGATDITGLTLSWPLADGPDGANPVTVSTDGYFSATSFAHGDKLGTSSAPTRSVGGVMMSQFQPTETAGANEDANALIFTMVPKKGITFTPTNVAFKAARNGTGGGKIDVEFSTSSTSKLLIENSTPGYTVQNNQFESYSLPVSGISANGEAIYLKIYVKGLANNKQYAFGDFVITGNISGEIVQVPVYTFSVGVADTEAGVATANPAGSSFDEGTAITVSASENFGYHFASWTDASGVTVSTANPYTFNIEKNTALTANYTKKNVYALTVALEGGANTNQVLFSPEGNVVNGVHHYEEGTDVMLTTVNNRILTFMNWEDGTTSPTREVKVTADTDLTATFSATDYIVGWDFYYDQPNSERAADYRAESDNAGLLSLRNAAGTTSTWLTRGVSNGSENGKWGARIWRLRSDGFYFELSFSAKDYSNIIVCASLGISYNSYSKFYAQYSTDGVNFTTFGTYNLQTGWTTEEFKLPDAVNGAEQVWVRYYPDFDSPLVGNATDYDGLCISELYVLGENAAADDNEAPVLVSSIPANGSTGASASGSIVLTFDEKVKAGTGNATLGDKTLTGTFSGKSVVYNYAGLKYATTYTFTLPAGAVTDRSGNPFAGTTLSFTTLERTQPEARLFDAIVALDGSGDYTTLQDAIDAAPAGRVKPWLIFVKNGEYKGHVNIPANKPMLHIIGQDRDKTILHDDLLCGGDNALHVSVGATVVVYSDDCFFENITLENSYGHRKQAGPQALALNTMGDRTIFNNVAMLSYQDTWITPSVTANRAYVRNSLIEGAVDFIYNSGDIYIDHTTLLINRKSGGFIVAPSHAIDAKWGYVFNHCTITAPGVPSETDIWLGRPWHNYPKTVFLNTIAEVTIPATGWYETMGGLPAIWADWNTMDANGNPLDLSKRRDTYYITNADGTKTYGTAKNHLTDEEAAEYTIANVLSGSDNWQPVIKTESCAAPVVTLEADGTTLSWEAVPYAICYLVTDGTNVLGFTTDRTFTIPAGTKACVQAVNEFGGLSSKAAATSNSALSTIDSGSGIISSTWYNLQGIRLSAPVKGEVCILRNVHADGSVTTSKHLVK